MGIIPPVTNLAPWTMPTGLGRSSTVTVVSPPLLALFNLGVSTLVYLPFVAIPTKRRPLSMRRKRRRYR
jgi:PTS system cellobiose-specific IIC component